MGRLKKWLKDILREWLFPPEEQPEAEPKEETREAKIERLQMENFWGYDGTPQTPVEDIIEGSDSNEDFDLTSMRRPNHLRK